MLYTANRKLFTLFSTDRRNLFLDIAAAASIIQQQNCVLSKVFGYTARGGELSNSTDSKGEAECRCEPFRGKTPRILFISD